MYFFIIIPVFVGFFLLPVEVKMRQHTGEELRNMNIKSIIQYFKDLHEENRRAVLNL